MVLVSNESEWGYYSDYVILMNEGRIMNEARGVTAIKYLIDWYLNE